MYVYTHTHTKTASWNVVRANVHKPEWLIRAPIKELLLTPEAQAAGNGFSSRVEA